MLDLSQCGPYLGLPLWLSGKEPACSAGDIGDSGSIPELGRSPGGGHGNLLQYSCLENPMDRGTWWTVVHWVTESWTRLMIRPYLNLLYLIAFMLLQSTTFLLNILLKVQLHTFTIMRPCLCTHLNFSFPFLPFAI